MNAAKKKDEAAEPAVQSICGIVRPIADMGDYTFEHWNEVHSIICEAAANAGYKSRLVSDNESVGVILGNIVSNLYNDPIIVCDVSGKNPNVMFELGMRMAFEKPVVIITDDATGYSFDISPVKHLTYPKTLRYELINKFKSDLASAIEATIEAHKDKSYKGYLQQFGPIKVAELGSQEVSIENVVTGMQEMHRAIRAIENKLSPHRPADAVNRSLSSIRSKHSRIDIELGDIGDTSRSILLSELEKIESTEVIIDNDNKISIFLKSDISALEYNKINTVIKNYATIFAVNVTHS